MRLLKNIYLLVMLLSISTAVAADELDKLFSFSSTATWKEFNHEIQAVREEKWVWVSSLTLKSKEVLPSKTIKLRWKGKNIAQLSASLYKKQHKGKLIPIEQNLVCDGQWDAKNQQFIFSINEKIIATNKYYLLLSFPKSIESILKKGKFIYS